MEIADVAVAVITLRISHRLREQPVTAFDLKAWALVHARVHFPIIAMKASTPCRMRKICLRQGADGLLDLRGKSGGIRPARDICDFAEKTGHSCTIGSNLEMGGARPR